MDMLHLAAARYNFTYTLFFPEDGFWGAPEEVNGSVVWNGIVGHLVRGVAPRPNPRGRREERRRL